MIETVQLLGAHFGGKAQLWAGLGVRGLACGGRVGLAHVRRIAHDRLSGVAHTGGVWLAWLDHEVGWLHHLGPGDRPMGPPP
jgi:hypothetical protein